MLYELCRRSRSIHAMCGCWLLFLSWWHVYWKGMRQRRFGGQIWKFCGEVLVLYLRTDFVLCQTGCQWRQELLCLPQCPQFLAHGSRCLLELGTWFLTRRVLGFGFWVVETQRERTCASSSMLLIEFWVNLWTQTRWAFIWAFPGLCGTFHYLGGWGRSDRSLVVFQEEL